MAQPVHALADKLAHIKLGHGQGRVRRFVRVTALAIAGATALAILLVALTGSPFGALAECVSYAVILWQLNGLCQQSWRDEYAADGEACRLLGASGPMRLVLEQLAEEDHRRLRLTHPSPAQRLAALPMI